MAFVGLIDNDEKVTRFVAKKKKFKTSANTIPYFRPKWPKSIKTANVLPCVLKSRGSLSLALPYRFGVLKYHVTKFSKQVKEKSLHLTAGSLY